MQVIVLNFILITLFLFSNIVFKLKRPRDVENIVFFVLVVLYLLVMSFRGEVSDILNYELVYKIAQKGGLSIGIDDILEYGIYTKRFHFSNMEIGYLVISSFFAKIGVSFPLYNFIIGGLELFIIFKYGRKVLNKLDLSIGNKFCAFLGIIVFYGLYYQFIAFRQSIVMALGVMASSYALEKRWIPSILVLLIMPSIHFSGLFFIPVILLLLFSAHKRRRGIFVFSIFLLFILVQGQENTYNNAVDMLFTTASYYISALSFYNLNEFVEKNAVVTIRIVYALMLFILLMAKIPKSKYWNLLDIIFFGVLIMTTLGSLSIVSRIYDICFFVFFVPMCYVLSNKEVKMLHGTTQICKIALILLFVARIVYNYRVLRYI